VKKFFVLISILLLGGPTLARAEDPVDLTIEKKAERYNLGISPFFTSGRSTPKKLALKFREIILADLEFSRLFNIISDGPPVKKNKHAAKYEPLGSQSVLTAVARFKSNGQIQIQAELIDVATQKDVVKIRKKGDQKLIRHLSHEVSNEIVKYFTGKPGIFTRKLTFVNDATGRKELYLADYDGKNLKRVTNDNSITILPRISHDGSQLVFTSYRSGNPDLYIMNTVGKNRRKLSAQAGLNVSPSWHPNGKEIAVTLSIDDSPNLYMINLAGKVKRPLTRSQGADTAPAISSDGSQIAFTSDRAGSPQIFVMNMDKTGLRPLTSVGQCDSAAWSPDGQTLAYVKGETRAKFDIYSIQVLTGIERRLTWAEGDNENPAWAPDGRFIIFTSTRRGKSELFIMEADGSNQKPHILNKGQSFTPHWGS